MSGAGFYVITADIIASRRQEHVPARAERGLAGLNRRHHPALAAEFTLYRGDEIQGALLAGADLIPLIRHLRFALLGLELRIGVGAGDITSGLEREFAWQMNGSAFHHARAALELIRDRREATTGFAGAEEEKWKTLNAFYSLIDTLQNRWSPKQWQAVDAYERTGTFAAAAAELGISPQNTAKRCRAAAWKAVARAERFLTAYLRGGGC